MRISASNFTLNLSPTTVHIPSDATVSAGGAGLSSVLFSVEVVPVNVVSVDGPCPAGGTVAGPMSGGCVNGGGIAGDIELPCVPEVANQVCVLYSNIVHQ